MTTNSRSEKMSSNGGKLGDIGDDNRIDANNTGQEMPTAATTQQDAIEEDERDVDDEDDDEDDDQEEKSPLAARSGPLTPMSAGYAPPNPYYYPPYGDAAYSAMTHPLPKTRRSRGGVVIPFPEKLHEMLEACAMEGLLDVVSFFPHGRAFAIHKPRRFVEEVMPRFFKQTKLTSFQRQLNLYGFQRIVQGPDNGGYYHELFIRGRPELCFGMKRFKVKSDKKPPKDEPNFYIYPPMLPAYGSSGHPIGYPPIAPGIPPPPHYMMGYPYMAPPPAIYPYPHAPYTSYAAAATTTTTTTTASPSPARPSPQATYPLNPHGYVPQHYPYPPYPSPHHPPPASTGPGQQPIYMPQRPQIPQTSPIQLTGRGRQREGGDDEGEMSPLKRPTPTKANI